MPGKDGGPRLGGMDGFGGGPRQVLMAECFAPTQGTIVSASGVERVRAACRELRASGFEVTYLGMLTLPDDEMSFHLFAAADAGVVREAGRRGGLQVERVVRSTALGWPVAPWPAGG